MIDLFITATLNQLLLPLFVLIILLGIAGVSPEVVFREVASCIGKVIEGIFRCLGEMMKPKPTRPYPRTGSYPKTQRTDDK